ncbi:MAG: hypothetical protein ACM3SY_21380 [Candidatus Omnitrophota bacterium]
MPGAKRRIFRRGRPACLPVCSIWDFDDWGAYTDAPLQNDPKHGAKRRLTLTFLTSYLLNFCFNRGTETVLT